ncbi:hypothetical protein [Massilia cavernae]|uniref:hypothetical protein n=1 Tax=Massilia cavernae TaxID=2320864 RepID=UPI0011C3F8B0|nr:hypothetical protein [Massilia cavernae]
MRSWAAFSPASVWGIRRQQWESPSVHEGEDVNTPLTIQLAEAAVMSHGSASALISARFFDTVVGCMVALAGGNCLHSPRFREVVGGLIRHFIPKRFT